MCRNNVWYSILKLFCMSGLSIISIENYSPGRCHIVLMVIFHSFAFMLDYFHYL